MYLSVLGGQSVSLDDLPDSVETTQKDRVFVHEGISSSAHTFTSCYILQNCW
jgi:hypothetical protein